MSAIKILQSQKKYSYKVKTLLKNSDLPCEDIDEHIEHFLLAEMDNEIIGAIGLEKFSQSALLRSFVVDRPYRKSGIGKILLCSLLEDALSKQIETLYLLTTTAQTYFEKNGFQTVHRDSLPIEIKNTKEFKSLCPVSAICMSKELKA